MFAQPLPCPLSCIRRLESRRFEIIGLTRVYRRNMSQRFERLQLSQVLKPRAFFRVLGSWCSSLGGHVAGRFSFSVGTAGSVPLILQAVMPSAAYAPGQVEFELIGGTDVPWSPTVDYVRLVELPVLQLMGYRATLTVHRRGHYPRGGGQRNDVGRPAENFEGS